MSFLERARAASLLRSMYEPDPPPREFPILDLRGALQGTCIAIIGEYKRASPRGIIRTDMAPWEYFETIVNHVDAFSVLTEPLWFLGDYRYVGIAKRFGRPVLFKDFVTSHRQVWQAFGYGADAVLLIYDLLSGEALADLADHVSRLGMTPLVEVSAPHQVAEVVELGIDAVIGANTRDLHTLEVSPARGKEIAREAVKRGLLTVLESGIKGREDVADAASMGVHGVLVGTALMLRPQLAEELKMAACAQ